ncbi:MAG: hypothetical protein ABL958_08570 [Bdellovibrionia bacterium]
MKTQSNMWKWFRVASAVAMTAFTVGFLSACSQAGGGIDPSYGLNLDTGNGLDNQNGNANNPVNPGGGNPPAGFNYYALYNSVTAVNVKVKQIYVRTLDGRVIEVPNNTPMLDLMKMETTDGVKVRIPGTGQETIVEVILRLHDNGQNQVLFNDGRTCKLKTHGEITLFARNALVLDKGTPYKVHGLFDPLEALSLNCTDSNAHSYKFTTSSDSTIHAACDDTNEENCKLRCALANSRFEISGVEFDDSDPQPTPSPTPLPDDNF